MVDFQGELFKNLNIGDIGLKIGMVLNKRYQICEYVSLGNMTIMYLAKESESGEMVLVKELAPVSMVNRDLDGKGLVPKNKLCEESLIRLRESFEYEINVIKKLADKKYGLVGSVPEYRDDFNENDTCYLVTSYFEGKDLQKKINDKEEIGFRRIASNLVEIVRKVHKAGVIHRDIKFSNIFIKNDGKIVLLDFGSSCSIENERKVARYVSNGFSAPELYDENSSTRWADNFSIGAVMYQMLTGVPPVSNVNGSGMYVQDIAEYINIPWQLALVIMKLLELKPKKRLKKLWVVKMLL